MTAPRVHSPPHADRWTDASGADVFAELTGCRPSLPDRSGWNPRETRASERQDAQGEAVAVSMQDATQQHIVDPIPRVDWRWGVFFWRRGYVNAIEPIGLVDSGEVSSLHARTRQRRRLFLGKAPFRFKYHLASTYRTASAELTRRFQQRRQARLSREERRNRAAAPLSAALASVRDRWKDTTRWTDERGKDASRFAKERLQRWNDASKSVGASVKKAQEDVKKVVRFRSMGDASASVERGGDISAEEVEVADVQSPAGSLGSLQEYASSSPSGSKGQQRSPNHRRATL